MRQFSFSKTERIVSKTIIQELFSKGSSFYSGPLKVLFLARANPEAEPHQVLVSVPKAHFKRAVDRNTIKRRIRESYRLNKPAPGPKKIFIAYIYTSRELLPSALIREKVAQSIQKILQKCGGEN